MAENDVVIGGPAESLPGNPDDVSKIQDEGMRELALASGDYRTFDAEAERKADLQEVH